jgi:hypothetical protein
MFFCQVPLETMKLRGVSITPEEEECCWQMWRYMGHVLGVDHTIIPQTYQEGQNLRVMERWVAMQKPTATSVALALNTLQAMDQDIRIPFHEPSFRALVKAHLGDSLFEGLGLAPISWAAFLRHHWLNLVWRYVQVCDVYFPFCQRWRNFWFFRYLVQAGVISVEHAFFSKKMPSAPSTPVPEKR